MAFVETLQNLVEQVPGAEAAMLMGYDGIPLAEVKKRDDLPMDLQSVAVEYSGLIREMKKNAASLGTEGLEEVDIKTGTWAVVLRVINEEFFALLLLSSSGYLGKGRYLLRTACSQVRSEL